MGCQEDTSVSEVVNAVNWVAANHKKPAIINLSLGLDPGQELPSQTLDVALNKLISLGVIVVSAAGNANADACLSSPPRNKGVISVGATDRTDSRASFSNYGQCVTLFACGVNIWSVKPNGGYAYKSGTSQASPFVAGVAALYLEANPSASPAQVMALLQSNAISGVVGSPNGSPNLLLQTIFKAPTAPIPPPSTAKNSSTTNNNTPPPVQNTQQRQSDKAKGIKINDNVTPSGTVGPMVDLDPPDSLVSNRQTDSKKITATTWAIIGGSTAACLLLGIAGIAVIRSRNKSVQAAQKHLFASNPRNSVFPPDTPLSSVAESPKLFSATGYPRSPTKSAEDLPQRRVSLSTSPRKKPLRLRLSISMQRASMMVLESPETPYMSLEDSIEYPPIADTDNRDISVATPATPSSQVFDSGDSLPVTISDRSTLSRKRSERPESMQDPAYFFAQQQPK
jgi:hypothetical protein